jgi:HEPN domain-containing protein
MYREFFQEFENLKNLGGKAWEHAVALDLLAETNIEDCSIHCFHYQQLIEYFFKHVLETKSKFGSYSKSHKLNKLLEEVIETTSFKTNKTKYRSDLIVITVCAEEYRYNFDIDCKDYTESVSVCDELVKELIVYEKT